MNQVVNIVRDDHKHDLSWDDGGRHVCDDVIPAR